MNVKLAFAAIAAVAAGLVGCSTPLPPGAEPGPDHTMAYTVLIEASAPGAHIEANGTYIGDAPVRLKIFGDPDGTFHDFGSYNYVIRATPITTNQFTQVRVFRTGHMMAGEDTIPPKIYFDMTRPEPTYVPVPVMPAYPAYPYPYYGYGPEFRFYFGGPGHYHHHW